MQQKRSRSRTQSCFNPHKQELLGLVDEAQQIELRWHLALMLPRLTLSGQERARAAASLQRYLEDRSSRGWRTSPGRMRSCESRRSE